MIKKSYTFIANALRNVLNKYVANTPQRWESMYKDGYATKLQATYQKARHYVICGLVADRLTPNASVLDVGCGVGTTYELLERLNITYHGIDIASQAIESASSMYTASNARFETANFLDFQSEECYDIIFFNEVLYYFSDTEIESTLSKAQQLLRATSGVLIISMAANPRANRIWRSFQQLRDPVEQMYLRTGIWGKWHIRVFAQR